MFYKATTRFAQLKTVSPKFNKAGSRFEEARMHSLIFYKATTHFPEVKTDYPTPNKAGIRFGE